MPEQPPEIALSTTAGEIVIIELEAAPGAGAIWSAPAAPTGYRLEEEARSAIGEGIGGPVRQRFAFSAEQPGRWELTFAFGRPWEEEVRRIQRVIVEVRPSPSPRERDSQDRR